MTGFKIDASEITKLATDFERAGGRVGRDIAAAVRRTTTKIENSARRNAPVGETGNLRDGVQQSITGSGRGKDITGTVFSDVPYARFVEEGTSVNRPQPWLGPAVTEHEDEFNREINQSVERVLDD